MKTKALVATLLVAAAASADARLASPFPRKPLPPDEIGHWIVINSNPWSHDTKAELATFTDGQTRRGEARPFGGGPDGLKSSSTSKEKAQLKTGMFIRVCGRSPFGRRDRIRSRRWFLAVKQTNDTHNAYEIDASEVQNSSCHRHSCEFALRG